MQVNKRILKDFSFFLLIGFPVLSYCCIKGLSFVMYFCLKGPCDEILLKTVCTGSKTFLYPRMVYPYNSVTKSLQLFLSRPGFWEKCQEWRKQIFPDDVKTDIYQGNVWKELSSTGFLSHINSLAVMLNVDWFRPHKHSPGSVGVLYLVLLSLPRHERYKLENIIVVGILLDLPNQSLLQTLF